MTTETKKSAILDLYEDLTPTAILCIFCLVAIVFVSVFAPFIAPFDEAEIISDESFLSAGDESLILGSDYLGRDMLSRIFYGTRVTVYISVTIATLAFFVGSMFGFLAATLGGIYDATLSRVVDALIAFPSIMLAMILVTALGPSIPVLIITIAFIDSTRVYRVARALAMDIIVQDYIEVAKVRGEGYGWIMWHEILPNAFAPLAAEFGIRFTYAILFISALSFLGLGVQPPHADLGALVRENMQGLLYGTGAPIYPALCIAMITISVNLIVDWFLKRSDASLPDEF